MFPHNDDHNSTFEEIIQLDGNISLNTTHTSIDTLVPDDGNETKLDQQYAVERKRTKNVYFHMYLNNKTHSGYSEVCEWFQGGDAKESWYLNTIPVARKLLMVGNFVREICILLKGPFTMCSRKLKQGRVIKREFCNNRK